MGLARVKEFFEEHRDETLIALGVIIGTVLGPHIAEMAYNAFSSIKAFLDAKLFKKKGEQEEQQH